MSGQFKKQYFHSLSEMASKILDPLLCKRTGLNIALLEHWPQIVGHDVSEYTMPLKIIWQRRANYDESFQPATLVVACERFFALKLMHETEELLRRINIFFGYIAIDRIKIEQKYIPVPKNHVPIKYIPNEKDKRYLKKTLEEVKNEDLRRLLYELGCCIFVEKNNK